MRKDLGWPGWRSWVLKDSYARTETALTWKYQFHLPTIRVEVGRRRKLQRRAGTQVRSRNEGHVLWRSRGCMGISWAQNWGSRRHTVDVGMWKEKLEIRWRRAKLGAATQGGDTGRNKRLEGSQLLKNCISQYKIGYTAIINDSKILA